MQKLFQVTRAVKFHNSSHTQIFFLCFCIAGQLLLTSRFSSVQHLLQCPHSHSTIPLCDFSISVEIWSGPLVLPFFSLRTAYRTSSNRIGPKSISRLSDASTMLNTELPLVVAGFNRCLKCSVQRSNLSSFVFRDSPVVETYFLI